VARSKIILILVPLLVVGTVVVLSWSDRSSSPPPVKVGEIPTPESVDPGTGLDVRADAPTPGTLTITAPPRIRGRVQFAIVGSDRILITDTLALGEETELGERAPTDQAFLVGAIDNLNESRTVATLQAECEWPRPVLLKVGQWPQRVMLEFSEPLSPSHIRVLTRTTAGETCPDIRIRFAATMDSTTAELPVAFVTTDEHGLAKSPALAPASYRVSLQTIPVIYEPASTDTQEVVLLEGEDLEVRFDFLVPGSLQGELRLDPPRRWSVTIMQMSDSSTRFVRSLTTDELGRFELASMPPGRYVAVSWPPGYMEKTQEFHVQMGVATEVILRPAKAAEGAKVVGRVLDESARPLRTDVNINGKLRRGSPPSGKGCQTGPNGEFVIEGASEGPKLAILWRLGYLRQFRVSGESKIVDLGTFRVPKPQGGASIYGHVVDEEQVPLRGTMVCLALEGSREDWIRFAETDGAGEYRFDSVQPGRYLLWHEPTPQTNHVTWKPPDAVHVREGEIRHDLLLSR